MKKTLDRHAGGASGRLLEPALFVRPVARYVARAGHHGLEPVQRDVSDRLEDLLVAPAGFARLLV
jgi:hypothetical protein